MSFTILEGSRWADAPELEIHWETDVDPDNPNLQIFGAGEFGGCVDYLTGEERHAEFQGYGGFLTDRDGDTIDETVINDQPDLETAKETLQQMARLYAAMLIWRKRANEAAQVAWPSPIDNDGSEPDWWVVDDGDGDGGLV